jgi:hypothetical protein
MWHDARFSLFFKFTTSATLAAKKTFVLRLDEDVYKALERWALDEFRSVNGQIEWLIDASLKKAGRKKEGKEKPKDESGSEE